MGQIKTERNTGGIEGLCVIEPLVHEDSRGCFMETYNAADMKEAGFDIVFVQDNQSSSSKGVIRGLHYQKEFPQTKLIRCIKGCVYDVAVDLRKDSPTYGRYYGLILSAENRKQLLIPKGFAHGFLVLSDTADLCYKCDDLYHQNDEAGLAWTDPDLGIDWPGVKGDYNGTADPAGYVLEDVPLTLSEKDGKWPRLKDIKLKTL